PQCSSGVDQVLNGERGARIPHGVRLTQRNSRPASARSWHWIRGRAPPRTCFCGGTGRPVVSSPALVMDFGAFMDKRKGTYRFHATGAIAATLFIVLQPHPTYDLAG